MAAFVCLGGFRRDRVRADSDMKRPVKYYPHILFSSSCKGSRRKSRSRRLSRRLITLIFAGRNRIIVIRRELPRTKGAGLVRDLPHRIIEDSPFRVPHDRYLRRLLCAGFRRTPVMPPVATAPSAHLPL